MILLRYCKGLRKIVFQVNNLFVLDWCDNLIEFPSVSFSIDILYIISLKNSKKNLVLGLGLGCYRGSSKLCWNHKKSRGGGIEEKKLNISHLYYENIEIKIEIHKVTLKQSHYFIWTLCTWIFLKIWLSANCGILSTKH